MQLDQTGQLVYPTVVFVEAGKVHRLARNRHLAHRLSLGNSGASGVRVAYSSDSGMQISVLVRLNRGEPKEHLVVPGLPLAHGRVVGSLADRASGPSNVVGLQIGRGIRRLQRLLRLNATDS